MKMTTEEAFVKVLQMHGIEHAFGIIGSAMMPISDLFPQAGITFWDAAHECNAGMMGLYPRNWSNVDDGGTKWAGHNEFCYPGENCLLEPYAIAFSYPTSRQQDTWSRRVSGS